MVFGFHLGSIQGFDSWFPKNFLRIIVIGHCPARQT
jgi:hypothetical protein